MLGRVGTGVLVATVFMATCASATLAVPADAGGVRAEQRKDIAQGRTNKATTEKSALSADKKKCERSGGLWVNGFCEMEG